MPYLLIRLFLRSLKQSEYRKRVKERFGYYPVKFDKCLWVHVVSVGETLAAIPLIKALQARYPQLPLLVTTMTPTGAQRVKAALGESVTHVYIPYDLPGAVSRFLKVMQPVAGILMETELWPNLIAACRKRKIPLFLMNARLSAKSASGYRWILPLTRTMLQSLEVIAAHGVPDAERFISLGAPKQRVMVTGNIKFDLELPKELHEQSSALRATLGKDKFIWIAASTHEGEEEVILAAHKILRAIHPESLLILVPRHPSRFDAVAKLCERHFTLARRSQFFSHLNEPAVYLGDTMGELLLMYGASDVAFVGGSLIPRGGHNILEAGVLGKAILTGPHLYNFAEISELFSAANALVVITDADTLAAQLIRLLQNPDKRLQMGQAALKVVNANRGALAKQVEILTSKLL